MLSHEREGILPAAGKNGSLSDGKRKSPGGWNGNQYVSVSGKPPSGGLLENRLTAKEIGNRLGFSLKHAKRCSLRLANLPGKVC